ncbi:uncharacterized protein N7458_001554 [Penicillium daleae]|uniref:Uncharacterized protein n=1 Tax=Penicillium daleae TaxID=63821 RepID=A0AAD6CBD2_9EURO|nr:uncharacterized protein N7458_001554 [Penicillium daleae]KAJ5460002.1 hypothetical protein N7458_001554 [Penicillium daleae]
MEGQASKTVPCYDDSPPQYDLSQLSHDVLTSVIENEHTCRSLIRRIDDIRTGILDIIENEIKKIEAGKDYIQMEEFHLKMGRVCAEASHLYFELANAYKERTFQDTDIDAAISKLSDSELDRAYASAKRDPSRQMQHEVLPKEHERGGECQDRDSRHNSHHFSTMKHREQFSECTSNSPCSCDRFFDLSAKVDKLNEKLSENIPFPKPAKISKVTDAAAAKPPRSFWKRILKL